MRTCLLVLTFVCSTILTAAEQEVATSSLLRISISARKTTYIVGEPMVFTVTWKNLGASPLQIALGVSLNTPVTRVHVDGPISPRCVLRVDRLPSSVAEPLKGTATILFDGHMQGGAVNPGDYQVWVVYDATTVFQSFGDAGVLGIRAESNHVRFRIVRPTGVDAAAFKKYVAPIPSGLASGPCNQVIVNEAHMKEFPTSTYVAYHLLGLGRRNHGVNNDPRDYPAEREYMAWQKARDTGMTSSYERDVKEERRLISYLERLERDFPDFTYRPEGLYALVKDYFRVGDPDKAVPVLKELSKRYPDSEPTRKAKDYRQLLKTHGIWPDESPSASPPTAPRATDRREH